MSEPDRNFWQSVDPRLVAAARLAACEVFDAFARVAPHLSEAAREWSERLYGSPLHEAFLAADAFPLLLFPWWFELRYRGSVDSDFQRGLMRSSIAGYLAIRLIDNVTDDGSDIERRLLPAANFLYSEFESVYRMRFRSGNKFWSHFDRLWGGTAEAAFRDSRLAAVSASDFADVSAKKTQAGIVPVVAVAYRYQLQGPLRQWLEVYALFARWHQFVDDLRDWQVDLNEGRATRFLTEMSLRLQSCESPSSWACLEGFEWAMTILDGWMEQMIFAASRIRCTELEQYLRYRSERIAETGARKISY